MAQDYSGQLDKSINAITAAKLSLHNLECWQINLHRCKTASYNMCEVTKSVRSGLVFSSTTMDICHKNQKQATRMEPLSRN